eukprot:2004397-Pyramimonas_sp.AAC.1
MMLLPSVIVSLRTTAFGVALGPIPMVGVSGTSTRPPLSYFSLEMHVLAALLNSIDALTVSTLSEYAACSATLNVERARSSAQSALISCMAFS